MECKNTRENPGASRKWSTMNTGSFSPALLFLSPPELYPYCTPIHTTAITSRNARLSMWQPKDHATRPTSNLRTSRNEVNATRRLTQQGNDPHKVTTRFQYDNPNPACQAQHRSRECPNDLPNLMRRDIRSYQMIILTGLTWHRQLVQQVITALFFPLLAFMHVTFYGGAYY